MLDALREILTRRAILTLTDGVTLQLEWVVAAVLIAYGLGLATGPLLSSQPRQRRPDGSRPTPPA